MPRRRSRLSALGPRLAQSVQLETLQAQRTCGSKDQPDILLLNVMSHGHMLHALLHLLLVTLLRWASVCELLFFQLYREAGVSIVPAGNSSCTLCSSLPT